MESTVSKGTGEVHQQVEIGREPDHSPISRCTLDVLMCIFEAVILTDDDKLSISTTISHVCRRWRQVALDMPKLWNEIEFSCTTPVAKIQSFLDRMIPRIKATPVDLWIDAIDWEEEDSLDSGEKDPDDLDNNGRLDLHSFQLNRIPVINCLVLEMCGTYSMADHLMNRDHAFRGCHIDGLQITFPVPDLYYDKWCCMELLEYFPSVFSLSLRSAGSAGVNSAKPTTQLRLLEIVDTEVPFLPILWSFPHLEELEFKLLSFFTNEEPDEHRLTVMTHLKLLDMMETEYSLEMLDGWLRQVSCPVLSSLLIGDTMIHAWIPFISSHRSIIHLETCELSTINKLSKVATQLQTLAISPQDEDPIPTTLLGDDIHAFNQLEDLFFHDVRPDVVSLEKFEEFVRARCLPSHHPDSQRPNVLGPLKVLRFSVKGANPEDRVWMMSELYQQAKKDVEVIIDWTHITLSWI